MAVGRRVLEGDGLVEGGEDAAALEGGADGVDHGRPPLHGNRTYDPRLGSTWLGGGVFVVEQRLIERVDAGVQGGDVGAHSIRSPGCRGP